MQLFAQNPQKGFAQLYKTHATPIFLYLRSSFGFSKEEAEDILQNVFLPWVREPAKFARIKNPTAYLFTSARNAALKFKAEKKSTSISIEASNTGHSDNVENGLIISNALAELPTEQKEAVVLKIWINLTFAEIAQLQQCSLQTVVSRYRYAIAKLKELIPWQN